MKDRKIQLPDGSNVSINDNDWEAVVSRKEFTEKETEILRISKHKTGLMMRVYVMRSLDGSKVAERNEIVVGDNLVAVIAKAIAECGLTRISAAA